MASRLVIGICCFNHHMLRLILFYQHFCCLDLWIRKFSNRLYTLLILICDSLAVLIQLLIFLVPLLIHPPVYIMGRLGAKLAETEEETYLEMKWRSG